MWKVVAGAKGNRCEPFPVASALPVDSLAIGSCFWVPLLDDTLAWPIKVLTQGRICFESPPHGLWDKYAVPVGKVAEAALHSGVARGRQTCDAWLLSLLWGEECPPVMACCWDRVGVMKGQAALWQQWLCRKEAEMLLLVSYRTIKPKPGLRKPPGSTACPVKACLCIRWVAQPASGMTQCRCCSHPFGQQPMIALHRQGFPPLLPMRSNSNHRHSSHLSTNWWIRALNLFQSSTNADHPTCISTDCFARRATRQRTKVFKVTNICFVLQLCSGGCLLGVMWSDGF